MTSRDNTQDTIVAIATAYGVGSISIIRMSGKDSLFIINQLIKSTLKPRYAHLCSLYDLDNKFLDEAIIIYFKAPFSFSGEDIVEIQCHGGIVMSKLILECCIKAGAKLAQAGEFSKRAFLNGKMDLSKIESISSMINAKNEHIVRLIANNLKGDLKSFVDKIRDDLVNILAYSEVSIDYGEEALPENFLLEIKSKLDLIKIQLKKIQDSSQKRLTSLDGYKITLIGKPNVGKSSLLNELLEYDRAIVSPIAGTTRDIVEDNIIINSKLVRLIDTAGIRKSSDDIESQGIEKTIQSLDRADIAVALFDSSCDIDKDDEKVLDILNKYEKLEKIIVFTKSDLAQKIDTKILKYDVKISSKNKDISSLLQILEDILSHQDSYDEVILTSQRQIDIIKNAIENINKSFEPLELEELELFSYHIQEAIEEIANITKSFEYSQLLDEIFSNFCLGK